MDFSKVIIMTDLDGTLLTDDKRILDKDLAAITRFREGGGIFTAATGRGYAMARRIVEDVLHLDVPSVLFNGAGVFDFKANRFLWQCEIGDMAREYIRRLNALFPGRLGFEVLHKQNVYVPINNQTEREHLEMESVIPDERPLDDIPEGGWLKFVIAAEPYDIDKVQQAVEAGGFEEAQWVRSAPHYFECLPKGVDKSRGFAELIRILNAKDRFSVAAGDYMNDTSMIQNADLGVAVASAQESVKKAADIVVCDNNSGAMSEIIDHIENM